MLGTNGTGDVPSAPAGTATARSRSMGKLRALVADDEPEMLDLVSTAVAQFGATVTRAASGHELLTRIAEDEPYDFIITDIAMPWMTGLQVMHSARTAGLPVPVIVMTAIRDPKVFEQVYALGERASLLLKPFTVHELRAALQMAIADIEEHHASL